MWRNALFATAATLVGIALAVFSQVDFLIPYKRLLIREHTADLFIFTAMLAVNLFAGYAWLTRKLLLKDTGRKLAHIEKQLREGNIAHELSDRLSAEE